MNAPKSFNRKLLIILAAAAIVVAGAAILIGLVAYPAAAAALSTACAIYTAVISTQSLRKADRGAETTPDPDQPAEYSRESLIPSATPMDHNQRTS